MKPFTKSLKDVGFLTIALTLALAANFAYGQWSNPPGSAPGGNVAAPVHTGPEAQNKNGALTVWDLNAINVNSVDMQATGGVIAGGGVRSDQYCDLDGLNC